VNWGEPPIVELQQNSMVGFVCKSEMSGIACTLMAGAGKGKGCFINRNRVKRIAR
jgi:hypothetical protein